MTWVFGRVESGRDGVVPFVTRLGLSPTQFEGSLREDGARALLGEVEAAANEAAPHAFPWFEVGRNSMLVANLAGTGAPPPIMDAAMAGYRVYLEEAGFKVEARDMLEGRLRALSSDSFDVKSAGLGSILERLREAATDADAAAEQTIRQEEAIRPMVTNYNVSIRDVVGPVNVLSQLDSVVQSVDQAGSLGSTDKAELQGLLADLREAVASAPASATGGVELVSEQAEGLVEELQRETPRKAALEIKANGLVEASKAASEVVPRVLAAASQIARFVTSGSWGG